MDQYSNISNFRNFTSFLVDSKLHISRTINATYSKLPDMLENYTKKFFAWLDFKILYIENLYGVNYSKWFHPGCHVKKRLKVLFGCHNIYMSYFYTTSFSNTYQKYLQVAILYKDGILNVHLEDRMIVRLVMAALK